MEGVGRVGDEGQGHVQRSRAPRQPTSRGEREKLCLPPPTHVCRVEYVGGEREETTNVRLSDSKVTETVLLTGKSASYATDKVAVKVYSVIF